ncbi:UNVERIFIED_CONTAM: ABC-2 type transport system ATP-binding protein [Acetivibrio alkalicellulosi]
MSEYAIRVNNLCKKYKEFSLDNISFELPKGYVMGFVGPNGAGKSTTIKCIMSLAGFESGSIEILGLDNRKHEIDVKQKIGYVSEEQHFYEDMTVRWTGNFVKQFYSNWDIDYFNDLIYKYNLTGSKKIKELSKGMKMKLSLALALSHHPEFLILDEPTAGLDPVARSQFLDILLELVSEKNCSILFSSHITEDMEKIADFITVIKDGNILLSQEKDDLLQKWKLITVDSNFYTKEMHLGLVGLKKGKYSYSGVSQNWELWTEKFYNTYPDGQAVLENVTLSEFVMRILL